MKTDPKSFSRTLRALDAEGISPTLLAIVLVAGLGGVWSGWLITARVPVYQSSAVARLEVERVHPVAATVAGRVVSTALVLGREVKEGDVLLEVEADRERMETSVERSRGATLGNVVSEIDREIAAEEQAIEATRRASTAALTEARQRLSATEAAARQSQDRLARVVQLERQGLISVAEAEDARANDTSRQAEVAAATAGIERLGAEQAAAERGRRARIAGLQRQRVELRGQQTVTESSVTRFEREADRRRVRAPVSGRLGEVTSVQIGAVIREGERLASIVPDGLVRIVAEFPPPALGRLRSGQHARVRLDGFPWTQYGYVESMVTSVASETREQLVRVELAVQHTAPSTIPLQHGMPGVVDVEVERVAPVVLLIRSLGYTLSGQPDRQPVPVSAESRVR